MGVIGDREAARQDLPLKPLDEMPHRQREEPSGSVTMCPTVRKKRVAISSTDFSYMCDVLGY